jgi:predicted DNA-binding transcriptional regulator AlpA
MAKHKLCPKCSADIDPPENESCGVEHLAERLCRLFESWVSRLRAAIVPRGLSAAEAAAYVGVSEPTFLDDVAAGRLPPPLRFGRRRVWDKAAIDRAFDRMSGFEPHEGRLSVEERAPCNLDREQLRAAIARRKTSHDDAASQRGSS